MIELKIELEANLLFVFMKGDISDTDIANGIASAGQLLSQLKENYSMIMDMTTYISTSGEQKALFNKIIKSMNVKVAVGQVIRIIGDSKVALESLCKMDKLFKFENIRYVPTMEDAIKLAKGIEDFKESKCV